MMSSRHQEIDEKQRSEISRYNHEGRIDLFVLSAQLELVTI